MYQRIGEKVIQIMHLYGQWLIGKCCSCTDSTCTTGYQALSTHTHKNTGYVPIYHYSFNKKVFWKTQSPVLSYGIYFWAYHFPNFLKHLYGTSLEWLSNKLKSVNATSLLNKTRFFNSNQSVSKSCLYSKIACISLKLCKHNPTHVFHRVINSTLHQAKSVNQIIKPSMLSINTVSAISPKRREDRNEQRRTGKNERTQQSTLVGPV